MSPADCFWPGFILLYARTAGAGPLSALATHRSTHRIRGTHELDQAGKFGGLLLRRSMAPGGLLAAGEVRHLRNHVQGRPRQGAEQVLRDLRRPGREPGRRGPAVEAPRLRM